MLPAEGHIGSKWLSWNSYFLPLTMEMTAGPRTVGGPLKGHLG